MNEWAKMAYDQKWLDQQPSDVWEVVTALKQQLEFIIYDYCTDTSHSVTIRVVGNSHILIEPEGHGSPIAVDWHERSPRVHIWSDANTEEATHIVRLPPRMK